MSDDATFDVDALHADALAGAGGASDFGDPVYREPLGVLVESLAVAPLNDLGRMILRGGLVRSLVNRLRTNDHFARFPDIAHEEVAAPIVVVGMMRSGTTLAQRLLAADPRHHCVLGWEAGEPAPRASAVAGEPDPRIADAEQRDEQTRQFFPELMAIHPTDAHEAEEEILYLADAFLSHVHEAYAHVPHYRSWLDTADFAPAYDHLHRTLQLLQWQKVARSGPRERWVLKTPAHLGYLDTLLHRFPDAHVVHLHRDPLQTIPSGASLNTTLWRMHCDDADVDPALVGAQWIERMRFTNDRAMAVRRVLAEDPVHANRFTDIRFADLVADPLAQVARVYDAVGVAFTSEARTAMQRWLQANPSSGQPTHRYTAVDFGLTDAQIAGAFREYSARFLS